MEVLAITFGLILCVGLGYAYYRVLDTVIIDSAQKPEEAKVEEVLHVIKEETVPEPEAQPEAAPAKAKKTKSTSAKPKATRKKPTMKIVE